MATSRWTPEEIHEHYIQTHREMRYVVAHSKHFATNYGPAPNVTVVSLAPPARPKFEDGVLRFDANGRKVN
jgi:hypothetical protein